MKILASRYFLSRYRKLARKDKNLSSVIDRKISIFQKNQNHPSLRLHKLSGKKIDLWSISLKKDLRITFAYVKEGILLTNIGSHNEVY